MLIEVNETIGRGLVASGIAKEASVPAVTPEPVLPWPRVLTVTTPWGLVVRISAAEAINPQWYPSLSASIVGQGGVLDDPSNGRAAGKPLRSPAGFPLQYALAAGQTVGTPSVMVGDQAFNSDSEALDYLARSKAAEDGKGSWVYGGVGVVPGGERDKLDPSVLAEWQSLPADDAERGAWLNRHPGAARLLLNGGHMSHAESSRYNDAAGGYK